MDDRSAAKHQLDIAIKEAGLAYQFAASSYTYGTLIACFHARDALDGPDWVEEILSWNNMPAHVTCRDPV